METQAIEVYKEWLNQKNLDRSLKSELMNIVGKTDEIEDRFYKDLDFGTAGLRGIMGAGTNRMNIYTVGAAAKGFADAVNDAGSGEHGILISYDSRNNSKLFAETCARVLASAGIKVLLSNDIRAVPILSFGIREYRCAGGIMITASHNAPEYNGLKVYGSDGGQLLPLAASQIKANIDNIVDVFQVIDDAESLDRLLADGRVEYVGDDLDDAYDLMLRIRFKKYSREDTSYRKKVKIVYTPLNGAGNNPVRRILRELGFIQAFVVSEQTKPDGDFPTLRVPNPEYEDTFDLAIKYAQNVAADVIIATDPDSDRLGVAVRDHDGNFQVLSGNQVGLLMMEYILSLRSRAGDLPENGFCVTSVVSSKLTRNICARYGVKLYQVFTGTKYIADKIKALDDNGDEEFIYGYEESLGYLTGKEVRDKDGIAGAAVIAEIAAISKIGRRTLLDQLDSIYALYGYAAENSFSIVCKGEDGAEDIAKAMEHYRYCGSRYNGRLGEPLDKVYDFEVKEFIDFQPESDVLLYKLEDIDFVAIRPSGTEPKLKVYFGCYGRRGEARMRLAKISSALLADIDSVIATGDGVKA